MTTQTIEQCIEMLEGKAHATGRIWTPAVAKLYITLIEEWPDALAVAVVNEAVYNGAQLPDVTELARMARDRQVSSDGKRQAALDVDWTGCPPDVKDAMQKFIETVRCETSNEAWKRKKDEITRELAEHRASKDLRPNADL